ncbi:universal stress protein A-like protein [Eucalyptus grandis]|uniref:universal stress protein A-like protein n=1 Tax=Eucalyptus grandis TaxID=71139 RepID=UPI00192E860C|nr:universal stress protein A-like protein [Eucalyptus grandis]
MSSFGTHSVHFPSSSSMQTPFDLPTDIVAIMERYNNEMADCFMAKAKKICHDFGRGGDERENGDARDVIYRRAQKLAPDVLVMGSHGYSLIKRLVIGEMWQGVSYHCAQNVKCPVLVVKRPTSSRNN